ncbi:Nramp family divalent metal transporter [Pseudalkalibacillus hwajinpoensis]|uniref:Nramp family divalent metal transporter n=1 Tax=Guptibacillus hwajinpoensis TaxID=208199 RepID=UPI001CD2753D|nr:Nramp family divalent metal transporter [Pseudalkalibacillus hwajinpoensis]MCA0991410.1 Nramp family divalent metal transporter [Pseudalkalibacillus hwajinpoensis]
MINAEPQHNPQPEKIEFKKLTWKQTLKSLGPGVIFMLTGLGAGDLVDSSVAGSHYGYALMWVLVIACMIRFIVVNILTRFELCNIEKLSLFEAYTRISKIYPFLFMTMAIVLGHMAISNMVKGSGEALYYIFNGFGSPFFWSVIVIISCFFLLRTNVYSQLENVMKVLLAVMTIAFIYLALTSTPDPNELAKGVFTFEMPEGTGLFGSLAITLSMIGAVAGSIVNFLYPRSIRAKGWNDSSYKKIQRNELLFTIILMIIINLSIWVVGAEILRPQGIEVTSLSDIARALEGEFGRIGGLAFYLGVFGALYSTILGIIHGYNNVAMDNLWIINPERKEKYFTTESDPLYKYIAIFFMFSAFIWFIPGMPGFIELTLMTTILQAACLPAIAIGLLFLATRKKYLPTQFLNNWFENIVLIGTTVLALWSSYKIVIELF